jgi:transposase
MARPRKKLGSRTNLAAVRKRLKDPKLEGWQRQRLQVVELALAQSQMSREDLAARSGVSTSGVGRVLAQVRKGGLKAILTRRERGKGPPSGLTPEVAAKFKERLREGQMRRGEEARVWLSEALGREVGLVVTYKYLGKCEARLKVPRPIHARQDKAAVETFRATLDAQLQKKDVRPAAPVRIWVVDEMRFGLQPLTRRVWTLRGVDPVVPVETSYKWGYTFGALEVGSKASAEFLHTDGVSQQASAAFYRQLAQSDKEATHIVIQDGAGFHMPAGHKRLPKRIKIITLPPYSPELNPIEKLWDVVKDRICNRVWGDLDELRTAIDVVLEEYWTTPELVRSLVGGGCVPAAANASNGLVLIN